MPHKLSSRQYKRLLGIADEVQLEAVLSEFETLASTELISASAKNALAGFRQFLSHVEETYHQADRDLALGKLSLELSSNELSQANETLRQDAEARQQVLVTLRNTTNQVLAQLGKHLDDDRSLEGLSQLLSGLVTELLDARKDVQRALAEVEKQKFALDQHAIVSITDAKGTLIYANEKFCTISKFEAKELIGQNHRIVNSGFHSKEFFQNLWHTIQSGNVWHGEIRNVDKEGGFYWTNATIVPFLNQDNQPYQYISIRTDITEQLRLREKIQTSQQLLQNVMDTLGEGVYTLDAKGFCTFVNPEAGKILGYHASELLGQRMHDLIHAIQPDGRCVEMKDCAIDQAVSAGKVFRSELEYFQHRSGILFPVAIVVSPIFEHGIIVGSVAAFQDVSSRIKADKALRESETKQRMLLDHAADAVFVANTQERWTYVNDLALNMLGYVREELIGQSIYDLLPREQREKIQKSFLHRLLEQKFIRIEISLLKKNGELVPVELNAALLPDGSIYGSCRDITERQRFESALIQAKEDAEAANTAKSEFLAMMSHEIRTPMNGIIGMTELALDSYLAPEQREYLELVKFSSYSLLGIINDILDFSKIESGKVVLEKIDFEIRELLASCLKALAIRASQKGIELVYKIDGAIPDVILGDPGRLHQIITNLVGNAIKFSEQGEIILDVQLVHQSTESLDIYFSVTDHGIGIPLDKQASIFSAFSQADASTTRKYGGTGLGLTISSRLVQSMHGILEVNSVLGKGSTFYFTARFEEGVGFISEVAVPNVSGLRVLIVDDNAINRHFFSDTLKKWGMHTVAVSSGADALARLSDEKVGENCFDLILLDVCMPEMDGFHFIQELQAVNGCVRQKVVVLSSAGSPDDARKCRDMGIRDYVTKPVSQHELLDSIVTAMSGNASRGIRKQVPASEISPGLAPLKIMVVEDNLVNQKLVLSLLKKWNHTAVLAETGLVALEKFQQENFDLILMDMQMPEMGGIEATQQIRSLEVQQKDRKHTPIIAMTANAMPGDWERCLDAGMDHYLSKPIKAALLQNFLSQYQQLASPMVIERNINMTEVSYERTAEFPHFDYAHALQSADSEIVHIIGHSFLDVCNKYIAELSDAVTAKDPELLHRSAHTMKGVVGNFCAYPIEELAFKLEQKGKDKNFEGTSELLTEIAGELKLLTVELKKFLDAYANLASE
ncbi:PAS domain S-box protein [Undibacterium jejuense]|uniref:Sensory/regulatory protein RpfC n=1 Tax=Undibacterium jejuense TaxID=1344949 RepID=A0A923KR59_9BURK|nr:PAS domain S-box protein [Undibacterium jejuense]MBC3863636.1 PAS domain S-box protein [Undibacterium jejuense]